MTAEDIDRLIAAPREHERLEFDRGDGDYTAERKGLLADVILDERIENVQHKEQRR
jgi:hypothetical protein